MNRSKSFVFVVRQPPFCGARNVEMLDQILAATAFDHPIDVLFLDDGVLQLLSGQRAECAGLRPLAPVLQTLEFYDVREVAAESESLAERALSADRLAVPVRLLARRDVPAWIAGHDLAVGCG
ncbi:sulfurtransferase complex subunit TusC [Methylococcus geothermalis]|uniref:Sulfurtransferase complex subunit TusC n=1 Tax=Methylococcus geothermalis TaxID=2681310 RepID=A0A858Q893_9GAMM|nr:sulfurtransferase complex subunit TusC [Methylococcus geothermalis]QJD30088.1 sulfurtransferase complex subunit TusC [Methylococcus geothermalis]